MLQPERVLLRWLGLSLALGGLATAAELYSWHGLDTPVVTNKRYEVALHARLRSRHELQYLDQIRVGGIIRWKLSARVIPFVGTYYQPQQRVAHQWSEGSRYFGGAEAPFRLGDSLALTTRLVAERFVGTGRPDYNRYRSSERLVIGRKRIAPFLQNECLAVRQGFHSTRNSGGLRVRVSPQLTIEGGYLFDYRRTAWGGNRQAIVTAIRWQR
jgi:hypothetical protein